MNITYYNCHVLKVEANKIVVSISEKKELEIFYEDIAFFADINSFKVGQELNIKRKGKEFLIYKANRKSTEKGQKPLDVRARRKNVMKNLDFSKLENALNDQVDKELKRLREEKKYDNH